METSAYRIVHLYNCNEATAVLDGLSLPHSRDIERNVESRDEAVNNRSLQDIDNLTISDKMSCACCDVKFEDRSQQVAHFKGDWHRYNLKRKLRGQISVEEDHFHDITDDVSSISGSGSDSEDDSEQHSQIVSTMQQSLSDEEHDLESFHVEGIGRRHPRVFVRNKHGELVSIYRAVVYSKKNQPETEGELIPLVSDLPQRCKWMVLMLAGGHFAGAIFDGEKVLCHKTFHRYVVRAKRGTVQSARDNQGNAPKSVGAYLRRHHEAALTEDIRNLLGEWASDVKSCDRIFLRATGSARQTMFNNKAPLLDKNDTRIRMIPFPTRRPTFNELKKVWETLSSIHCHGKESELEDHIKAQNSPRKSGDNSVEKATNVKTGSPRTHNKRKEIPKAVKHQNAPYSTESDDSDSEEKDAIEMVYSQQEVDFSDLQPFETAFMKKPQRKKKKKLSEKAECSDEKETVEVDKDETLLDPYAGVDVFCGLKNNLYTAVKTNDSQGLTNLLTELRDLCTHAQIPLDVAVNRAVNDTGLRLLHLACKESSKDAIWILLDNGADPALKDKSGGLPYILAKEKAMRNEFRKFMAEYPDRYDYHIAQVPGPLSEEKEAEKKAKDAEKRKAAKKAKTARLKERKEEEKKIKEEEREKQRYLNLSDREKRALAAERRLMSQAAQQGQTVPVTSRCFQCAIDMTGKVPFEYNDNRFCSPPCLQKHRKEQKTATGKSVS